MTKIEEIEQRLEVMEQVAKAYRIFKEEVEQLQKALAELKESKKEGKWKPNYGARYWFRNDSGDIFFEDWFDDDEDFWRYNNIPIFKTQKECERYWHFMDTIKEKSYEFSKEEWEDWDIYKYYISYKSDTEDFRVLSNQIYKYLGQIYFKATDDAQYIIDNFKEELMEYWL